MEEDNAKYDETMQKFSDIVAKLSKLAEDSGLIARGSCLTNQSNLEFCTLEIFNKLNQTELKLFIRLLCTDER